MTGQIPLSGGRIVKSDGKTGVVFDDAPEAKAFARWRAAEFSELERTYAADLRCSLAGLDLTRVAATLQSLGITNATIPSLQDAKAVADNLVEGYSKRAERLYLALQVFHVPAPTAHQIAQRWEALGRPLLNEFAPYAAYVLTVEFFFQLAIGAQLIGSNRKSNRTDIAYLFYLPFSHAFVSSDDLHRKCAPLFLRGDQKFVWGIDLKSDLKRLNVLYSGLPESERDKGIIKLAPKPPMEDNYLTAQLYDQFDPSWREDKPIRELPPDAQKAIVDRMNAMINSTDILTPNTRVSDDDLHGLSVPHIVRRKKGSWYQVPKDLDIPQSSLVQSFS